MHTLYEWEHAEMIKSFKHKGLEKFYRTDSKAGIFPSHAKRLAEQLATLNRAADPKDMDFSGWGLHSLHGNLANHWAVKVNGNWRLTFRFIGEDAEVVDYQDYH